MILDVEKPHGDLTTSKDEREMLQEKIRQPRRKQLWELKGR